MYTIVKELEFSASHKLYLDYTSPCIQEHGHNYKVIVKIANSVLNKNGMILDFAHVKQAIMAQFDHKNLNDVYSENGWNENPTAETLAYHIKTMLTVMLSKQYENILQGKVTIRVYETPTSYAEC